MKRIVTITANELVQQLAWRREDAARAEQSMAGQGIPEGLDHPHAATRRKTLEEHERASLDRVAKSAAHHTLAQSACITEEGDRRAVAKSLVEAHEAALEKSIASEYGAAIQTGVARYLADPSRPHATALMNTVQAAQASTRDGLGSDFAAWHLLAAFFAVTGGERAAIAWHIEHRNHDFAGGGNFTVPCMLAADKGNAPGFEEGLRQLELNVARHVTAAWPPVNGGDAERFALLRSLATRRAQDAALWAFEKGAHVEPVLEAEPVEPEPKPASWFEGAVDAVTRAVTSHVSTGPQ